MYIFNVYPHPKNLNVDFITYANVNKLVSF